MGPAQPRLDKYPQTLFGKKHRSFRQEWYETFPWLEYSQSADSIFCFACRHFASPNVNVEKSFTTAGYRSWKHAGGKTGAIAKHIHAAYHGDAMVAWSEYKTMKDHNTSVRQLMGDNLKTIIKENRHYIKSLGQVILVTCTQKLAQRGHREGEESDNPGNVRQILELVAVHDPIVKKRLEGGPKNAKYTCPEIQNEIISILAEMIRTEIVNEVKEAKFFSIIVDETKDVSKTEQLSLILGYY